jgi:predicted Zn-ribbon and HTH transcriptional regulator
MTEEEANISQVIEDACGCPLRELPDDSEWWEVYDELINEQKKMKPMSKKLKTLEVHNAQASSAQFVWNNEPQLNGIACPKCGAELYDTYPMQTLTSMPSQKNVHCSVCDYVGYRIA